MQAAQHSQFREPPSLEIDRYQHVNSNRNNQQAELAVLGKVIPLEKRPIPSFQQVYSDAHPLSFPSQVKHTDYQPLREESTLITSQECWKCPKWWKRCLGHI